MKLDRYKCYLAAAALALTLTGCGGDEAKTTEAEQESTTEATEQAASEDSDTTAEEGKSDSEAVANSDVENESTDNTETENTETADNKAAAVTMYTTESITLRKEASGSSENLGVVAIGSTIEAYETSGDYIRVTYDGKEGYVLKDYVTEDKETADKAVEASKQAQAESSDSKSSGKKEKKKKANTECLENGLLN